jgi:uncharacterized protein
MLKVDVKELKDKSVVLHIDERPDFFELSDKEFLFFGHVVGEVEFQRLENEIIANGFLRATAKTRCVRCLDAIELTLEPRVHLTYAHDPSLLTNEMVVEMGAEVPIYYDGESINPRDDFRELILLDLPNFPMCSPHCKGLCAGCGTNLNREQCRCKQKTEGPDEGWKSELRNINLRGRPK